jgi:hypothetical protein
VSVVALFCAHGETERSPRIEGRDHGVQLGRAPLGLDARS